MEGAIMRTAECLNPKMAEEKFNNLVNEGVRDYKALLDFTPKEGAIFDNAILSKFSDLFNLCIDIKKKKAIEAAEAAEVTPPPPKSGKPNNRK